MGLHAAAALAVGVLVALGGELGPADDEGRGPVEEPPGVAGGRDALRALQTPWATAIAERFEKSVAQSIGGGAKAAAGALEPLTVESARGGRPAVPAQEGEYWPRTPKPFSGAMRGVGRRLKYALRPYSDMLMSKVIGMHPLGYGYDPNGAGLSGTPARDTAPETNLCYGLLETWLRSCSRPSIMLELGSETGAAGAGAPIGVRVIEERPAPDPPALTSVTELRATLRRAMNASEPPPSGAATELREMHALLGMGAALLQLDSTYVSVAQRAADRERALRLLSDHLPARTDDASRTGAPRPTPPPGAGGAAPVGARQMDVVEGRDGVGRVPRTGVRPAAPDTLPSGFNACLQHVWGQARPPMGYISALAYTISCLDRLLSGIATAGGAGVSALVNTCVNIFSVGAPRGMRATVAAPEEFDPEGPYGVEPFPFQTAGAEKCHRMLNTWLYKCQATSG